MAYVPPTFDDFTELFPQFEDSVLAELAFNRAVMIIDDSWLESDRTYAIFLLTAHTLAAAEVGESGGRNIASETIGPLSVSYFQNGAMASAYMSTPYGSQLYMLAQQNFPQVMVV